MPNKGIVCLCCHKTFEAKPYDKDGWVIRMEGDGFGCCIPCRIASRMKDASDKAQREVTAHNMVLADALWRINDLANREGEQPGFSLRVQRIAQAVLWPEAEGDK